MSAPPDIQDRFHRKLYEILEPEVAKRMGSLAAGSAGNMEQYRDQVAWIAALTRVMEIGREIEADQYGPKSEE